MRNLQLFRYVDAVARTGSIRRAAEELAITPSALNRRILALEEEMGVELFERLGRGVRLSTAGELSIHSFRRQLAEADQLRSRIADLSGLRRGHVSIACSQALLPYFIPEQIHLYQADFPDVTFRVQIKDGAEAADSLSNYGADFAIVFEAMRSADFDTLISVPQTIHAVMARDHPLAQHSSVKLSDCAYYDLALPPHSYAVRRLLEGYANRMSMRLRPAVEADSYVLLRNFAGRGKAIAFELEIGVPPGEIDPSLVSLPLSVPNRYDGSLYLVQLKGRTLSVAAARFAQQIREGLVQRFERPAQ
ncbi:MAG: LysR family transcriptional regulator [Mangrovicoccus sp.]|nr:LysR family transcriptional regulator [Mangrovicoccus sp.]